MEISMPVFTAMLVVAGVFYFVLAKGLFVGWTQIQEKVSCAGSVMGIVSLVSFFALFMFQSMKVFWAPAIAYAILYAITVVIVHGKKLFGPRKPGQSKKGSSEGLPSISNHKQEEGELPSALPPPVRSQGESPFR